MKKPVGRLLYPNTGWYFAAMLLFTAAAAAVGQYILAGGALFVTLIMFIISRARLSRRKRQLMSYVQTATDSVGISVHAGSAFPMAVIRLPEGERLPENIVTLTGITDRLLETEGVQSGTAVSRFLKLVKPGPVLMVAHNAQFDACFLRGLLRGQKVGRIDWLDSLTVYKDRRAYPHKLANAIIAYDLTDKVQNSHRAIDDVLALFEVLKAMDDEREDLGSYVNLFGYNPKYGVSGRRIVGVRYEPQSFSKGLTRPEQTLPARVARR